MTEEEITLDDYVLTNINIDTKGYVIRLKDNKEYSDYETLNRFKYNSVFDKTYIKNSKGSAMIKLKDILYLCQIKDDLERSDYSLLWVMSQ